MYCARTRIILKRNIISSRQFKSNRLHCLTPSQLCLLQFTLHPLLTFSAYRTSRPSHNILCHVFSNCVVAFFLQFGNKRYLFFYNIFSQLIQHMANYPQEFAQDAVCQSHIGHMTGLWFLPARPLRLNTNEMNELFSTPHCLSFLSQMR